ncbi:hypothetical protein [Candidatus Nitrospira bockiana]
MPSTPEAVAESLLQLITSSLVPETFAEYHLDLSPGRMRDVRRELLALDLYWAGAALDAHLGRDAARVRAALDERLRTRCDVLQDADGGAQWTYIVERQTAYAALGRQGDPPIAFFTEAADRLESTGALDAEQRRSFLALSIDLVPVEAFGELIEQIDLIEETG